MTKALALIVLGSVGIALPLLAESGNPKLIEITNTQQVPFQPGGTIHIDHSSGYLSVEGWDRPEVEITVVKSLDKLYEPKNQGQANKRAEAVRVTAERKSDTDLEISTARPHYSRWTHPLGSDGGVKVEYQIHAPRNSKLVIHHEGGDVLVNNVTADIEATGSTGELVVLLPETGKYAIDAKSKLGTVSSDFDGDFHHVHWVGVRYADDAPAPAHKIFLRMGVGGITIKSSPPAAQPPAAAAGVQ